MAAKNFTVFLADALPEPALLEELEFRIIPSMELSISAHADMTLRYSIMEFNTAIKPFCIECLFTEGAGAAVYLDPDIMVLTPLSELNALLSAGANIVLTPHSLNPLEDGFDPDDVRLMQTGIYNLGFGAFANTDETKRFVAWWGRQLETKCVVDLENGIFVDQKFMDMAPAYCSKTEILRHPGYNVAYWNLANRQVTQSNGEYSANDEPIRFFHFSGVIPGDASVFSKHQNRFGVEDIGCVKALLHQYLSALETEGHQKYAKIKYAFSTFPSGEKVTAMHRNCYAALSPSPIIDASHAYKFAEQAPRQSATEITPLAGLPTNMAMQTIWNMRPDLARNFPIGTKSGYEQFCRWYVTSGAAEHSLPNDVVEPIIVALDQLDQQRAPTSIGRGGIRSMARAGIRSLPFVRPLFRQLPETWRSAIRGRVFRAASSGDIPNAPSTIQQRGALNSAFQHGLGVYGYLRSVSGVGEGARRTIKCLEAANIQHSRHLAPSLSGSKTEASITGVSEEASPHRALLFHVNADQTPFVLNSVSPDDTIGRYRIGYWAWELSRFPDIWDNAYEYLDEIWVPSEFVAQAVRSKTTKSVYVVPHAITDRRDERASRIEFGLPENRFLILCSMDLNSFRHRKNPDGAYEAFKRAFPDRTDTSPLLVVKIHGGEKDPSRDKMLETYLNDDRVILIDAALSSDRYARLQQSCDAYLSLHRSEGFGLNIAECMHMGISVVATNYGGNTDFTNEENSYPVRYKLVDVQRDEYVDWHDQVWAEPDLDDAAEQLKIMVSDKPGRQRRAGRARQTIVERFGVETIGAQISDHLKRIDAMFEEASQDS